MSKLSISGILLSCLISLTGCNKAEEEKRSEPAGTTSPHALKNDPVDSDQSK